MRNLLLLFAIAIFVSLLPGATRESAAHPFHVSFAEVDWNSETGRLEVALKIDPDDLEQAVRRHFGKRVDIDKKESTDSIAEYLSLIHI